MRQPCGSRPRGGTLQGKGTKWSYEAASMRPLVAELRERGRGYASMGEQRSGATAQSVGSYTRVRLASPDGQRQPRRPPTHSEG